MKERTREKIALIPARGGSKRISGKNIKIFCGRPMIAWPIEAALESDLFERVIVSTDDDEIAAVARKWGAEIPFKRPAALADEYTGTDAVFIHGLKALNISMGYACCIYATAPLIQTEDLRRGLAILGNTPATSVFSVTRFSAPIFRALQSSSNGRLDMFWPEYRMKRSQDLPEAWHDAGQFYWVDVEKYLMEGRLFSSNSYSVKLPAWRVQDIDTEEDWSRAELIFNMLRNKNGS